MAKPKCVPLRVTAHLVDGRLNSAGGIVMLDAILYHAWFIRHAPHVLREGGTEGYTGYIGLPLRQLPGNRWAASRAVYQTDGQLVEQYSKRPDFFAADKMPYLDKQKGIISSAVGPYRAYRNPSVIRVVKGGMLTFYAVGHVDEVAELLDLIPAVGKKMAMGYGAVDRWQVEEIDEDYTTEHPEHGLMRPMPVEEAQRAYNCPVMQFAVRPPYYKACNMRLCYVPVPEAAP